MKLTKEQQDHILNYLAVALVAACLFVTLGFGAMLWKIVFFGL